MSDFGLPVAWYRLRTGFRHRVAGYVSLVVLVALVGGLGLGSLAAARRTQSSFSTFLASTNPSDLDVTIYGAGGSSSGLEDGASLLSAIRRLPGVAHVAAGVVEVGAPLTSTGAPRIRATGLAYPIGGVNGLFFTQDRMAVTQGRMSSPRSRNEIVMSPVAALLLGFHVGQVIPFGFYTQAQENEPGFGTSRVAPALRVNLHLVGLASLSSEIVQDDVDTLPTFLPLTPTLSRELLAVSGGDPAGALTFGLQTRGGTGTITLVEREVAGVMPAGVVLTDHSLAPVVAKADRSLKPIAIALGVFGVVALLAAVLIGAQLIARRLRTEVEDLRVLRALGADPVDTFAEGFLGTGSAIVVGCLLAGVVAVALSPLAPLGPVRPVSPDRGFAVDWTVVGLGVLLLLLVLGTVAAGLAALAAPHRVTLRTRIRSTSGTRLVAALARAGLPASGVVGVRMAVEPGEGRSAVPVRSALLGSCLAVALVVTTVTFASSLQTLVANPPLYGWNWSYILNPVGSGGGEVPQVALSMLKHDPYVAAYSGVTFNDMEIDGQGVPNLLADEGAPVAPPILSGHGLRSAHDVVLGAATMALLHKHLGQYVTVSYGNPKDAPIYVPPTRLRVVGSATFPAIGYASTVSDHTSMGTGALMALQMLPKAMAAIIDAGPTPALSGPNLALIRLRADAPTGPALGSLDRIVGAADRAYADAPGGSAGNGIVVQGVQRPAEIVDYKTIGLTPTFLVGALALGAVAALALTLAASVRQRRRDLALLKTIGFVRRQLAAAVAWQASVAALAGIIVGIPLGIVAGRWLWDLFARQIYAVPYPTVPAGPVLLVALATLALANVVAAVPARRAARTPTAMLLRTE